MAQTQELTPQTLLIVRLAIAMGVVIIGVVGWLMASDVGPSDDGTLGVLRIAFFAVILGALAGLLVIRRVWQAAETFQKKGTLSIVATAIGEAPALFGGVYMMLSGGDFTLYLGGLLVLVLAFILFPVQR